MDARQIIGTVLLIVGIAGLIIGVFGIFGESLTNQNPWIFAILGFIFFTSGIGLLKSVNNQKSG